MDARSEQCRKCKPSYERTVAHNQKLSALLTGRPKPWLKGRKRPDHAETMREWWTAERKAKMRQRQLKPSARYHGLSSRQAAAIVRSVGKCERCSHDGSKSRLGVHHRNRDKHDQRRENLEVVCHRCHMREHRLEIGWASYHRKRKTIQG